MGKMRSSSIICGDVQMSSWDFKATRVAEARTSSGAPGFMIRATS